MCGARRARRYTSPTLLMINLRRASLTFLFNFHIFVLAAKVSRRLAATCAEAVAGMMGVAPGNGGSIHEWACPAGGGEMVS